MKSTREVDLPTGFGVTVRREASDPGHRCLRRSNWMRFIAKEILKNDKVSRVLVPQVRNASTMRRNEIALPLYGGYYLLDLTLRVRDLQSEAITIH